MEEWHQKLHNNSSPDDIVICQALIAFIESDLDMSVYWKTLEVDLNFSYHATEAYKAVSRRIISRQLCLKMPDKGHPSLS